MPDTYRRFHLLTGGPGSGKSTMLDVLERKGFTRSVEAGRGIIKDQMRIGGCAVPWHDPLLFAELMLAWEMRNYAIATEAAKQGQAHVFFDRGIPDIIGYLVLSGVTVPAHIQTAAQLFKYAPRVFIAPPWPEIFTNDSERKQSYDEAVATFEVMASTYKTLGYTLVHLPLVTADERAEFMLAHLDRDA